MCSSDLPFLTPFLPSSAPAPASAATFLWSSTAYHSSSPHLVFIPLSSSPPLLLIIILHHHIFFCFEGHGAEESLYWVAYATQPSLMLPTATNNDFHGHNPMLESRSTPKVTSAAQIAADKVLGEVSELYHTKYFKLKTRN